MTDPELNAVGWARFHSAMMRDIMRHVTGNETMAIAQIASIVEAYRVMVYPRFERLEDCGKKTVDKERRCLHHVISPLDYNESTHHFDFAGFGSKDLPMVGIDLCGPSSGKFYQRVLRAEAEAVGCGSRFQITTLWRKRERGSGSDRFQNPS